MNHKSDVLLKKIIKDINNVITELRRRELIRDEQGLSQQQIGTCDYTITFSGKNGINTIMYDKHIPASRIMNELLSEGQYTILLYDKGIIQAEFMFKDGDIVKERLVFMKRHNRIWNQEDIILADSQDEDWFDEEDGIPVFLRVDYDPNNHVECDHAAAHLTISNIESCRIPMQNAITFSEFVGFILFHFYNIKLEMPIYHLDKEYSITKLEQSMIHLGWNCTL